MRVALVSPEIPQNTGNIARTCAATGAQLHLVIRPLGFGLDDRYLKRAGLDYWPMARVIRHPCWEGVCRRVPGRADAPPSPRRPGITRASGTAPTIS